MSINYETVPSPNYAAYANPGFGAQLGQMLQGLPDQYMKGRQNAQQMAAEDMFKNEPIPRNKDGSVNVDAVVQKGAKIGGLPFVMKMLPFLSPPPNGGPEPTIGDDQSSPSRPPPVSSAAGPSSMGTQPPQPQLSSAGTDSTGDQTINSLASEVFGERDVTNMLPKYAAAVGNKLGEPLTAQQEQAARTMMQRTKGSMASALPGDTAPPTGGAERGPGTPNGASTAPFMAGGASGAPAPAAGNGAPPTQVAQAQPAAGGGLPPNWTEKKAGEYETSARNHMKVADYYARLGNKEAAQNQREQANKASDTAKMIREGIKDRAAFTGPQKEARDEAVAVSKGANKFSEDIGAAKGKRIGEVIESGGLPNRQMVNELNVMEDALKAGGKNISTGPGAEQWLKVAGRKQPLSRPFQKCRRVRNSSKAQCAIGRGIRKGDDAAAVAARIQGLHG
jgi:hypothetical protein